MKGVIEHLRTRPRLALSLLVGAIVGALVPDVDHAVTRVLVGWDTAVWLFLTLALVMMLKADHQRVRSNAIAQAEGAPVVLGLGTLAAVVSIVAIVLELAAVKGTGAHHVLPHVLLALVTVAGSWLLLPMLFAMSYASLYYLRSEHGHGLDFPTSDKSFRPDYADFLYFAFTIAVASQTADVAISTRSMRRLVLLQALLAFAFNTTILAFSINIAAGLF